MVQASYLTELSNPPELVQTPNHLTFWPTTVDGCEILLGTTKEAMDTITFVGIYKGIISNLRGFCPSTVGPSFSLFPCQDWERIEGERRRVKAAEMEERAKLKEPLGDAFCALCWEALSKFFSRSCSKAVELQRKRNWL